MSLPPILFGLDDVKITRRVNLYEGFFHAEKIQLSHRLYAGGWSLPLEREVN